MVVYSIAIIIPPTPCRSPILTLPPSSPLIIISPSLFPCPRCSPILIVPGSWVVFASSCLCPFLLLLSPLISCPPSGCLPHPHSCLPVLSPCSLSPPRKQLLTVVVGGAVVVWSSRWWCGGGGPPLLIVVLPPSLSSLSPLVTPPFHPVSSCSQQWLGVLLWWWWWSPLVVCT